MELFAILLAGRAVPTAALRQALAGRRIIAADGGIAHAANVGLVPELWVGDFDSVPADLPAGLAGIPRRSAPREKDETDAELAVDAALSCGARDILIVGALGGPRSDHAFSNLVLATRLAEAGLRVELFDGVEQGFVLGPSPLRVEAPAGRVFSILRFGDVTGLTVAGARWPLNDADIAFGSVVTQSNETRGPIEASLRTGRALLLMQCEPA